jgi:hypothetical protein
MTEESSVPPQDEKPNSGGMRIVGINLAVLAVYTIISALIRELWVLDMFFIGLQFVTCIVMAIVKRKWSWLLSGILVLVIGFSTCVSLINISMH